MSNVTQIQMQWRGREAFGQCTREIGADSAARGVRLARTVMFQDERGRTHIHNRQELGEDVMAMKQFLLTAADCVDGRLYIYGEVGRVSVNGAPVKPVKQLPSTGWQVVRVPGSVLREGINEVVFAGAGFLLVEDSVHPDRSAVSCDGGATWDFDAMGPQGMNDGEFLVRLRLQRYPSAAAITSPPVDLAEQAATDGVCPEFTDATVSLAADFEAPGDSAVALEMRFSTDGLHWEAWRPADEARAARSLPRWLQWRAHLLSPAGDVTPTLRSVDLQADVRIGAESSVRVVATSAPAGPGSSHGFAYQLPTDRLKRLAEQYKLADVVAGEETELSKLAALRDWCRHTAPKGWDMGRTDWCPPWDALVILEMNQDPRALCMCTHYSTLFVQTALALGWTARHVIVDHHCVAEVWCNDLAKWVVMDTGNSHDPERNCHFEHEGIPLNSIEIRRMWKTGRSAEVWSIYRRRRRLRADRIKPKDQCALLNWRRFGVPLRNNHLDTPFPGELTEGWGEYFCDAYLWYEERPVPVDSPEYGLTSDREADFYWPVSSTSIQLEATDAPRHLRVVLSSAAPNLKSFQVSKDGGDWRRAQSQSTWRLTRGEHSLEARCMNAFGAAGPVSRVDLIAE